MTANFLASWSTALAPVLLLSAAATGIALAAAPCAGPGAPSNTQTKCLTAIAIPIPGGTPLTSFDISFVNPHRGEYYLGDRSSKGIDIIDTKKLKFVGTAGLDKPFQGVVLVNGRANNAKSGPDGVASHGRWLYAGDGDSTLHVIDLEAALNSDTKQVISTGGLFRLDEMALTTDGKLLLAANNADDPPFATLFSANGDNDASTVTILMKISV